MMDTPTSAVDPSSSVALNFMTAPAAALQDTMGIWCHRRTIRCRLAMRLRSRFGVINSKRKIPLQERSRRGLNPSEFTKHTTC